MVLRRSAAHRALPIASIAAASAVSPCTMPQAMDRETARVEAFSDGVFGIAMTLLILEFHVPVIPHADADARRQLIHGLLELWPAAIAFLLSFGTILIMWINHHGLFKHAHHADNRLFFANGFLLLIVTFVPFPTWVLAAYLDRRGAQRGGAFFFANLAFVFGRYKTFVCGVLGAR